MAAINVTIKGTDDSKAALASALAGLGDLAQKSEQVSVTLAAESAATTELRTAQAMAAMSTALLREAQAAAVTEQTRLAEATNAAALALKAEESAARTAATAQKASDSSFVAAEKLKLAQATQEDTTRLKEEAQAAKLAGTDMTANAKLANEYALAQQKLGEQSALAREKMQLQAETQRQIATSAAEAKTQLSEEATSMHEVGAAAEETGGRFSILRGAMGDLVAMGLQTAFFGITNTVSELGKSLIETDASFEQLHQSLTFLLGSSGAADDFLGQLQKEAQTLPFHFEAVQASAQKMLAEGFDTKGAIDGIQAIADTLSAMGKTSDADMVRMVDIFAQLQATGKMTGMEMKRLRDDGVPALQYLADYFHVTTEKAQEMVSKGVIPASDAIAALQQGMEKQFGGAAQAQMSTFNGLMNNMQDDLMVLADTAGKPIFDAFKTALTDIKNALENQGVKDALTQLGAVIGGALTDAINFVANTAIPAFVSAWNTIGPILGTVADVVTNLAGIFGGIASDAFGWGANIVGSLADGMGSAVGAVVDTLSGIGATITDMLESHSPPKLLPKLTDWGRAAMQSWVDGMAADNLDFGAFDKIRDTVEGLLNGFAKDGAMNQKDVIPTLFGTEQAMATLLEQLAQTGQVSQQAFDAVIAAAGPAGDSVRGLLSAEVDVAEKTRDVSEAQKGLDTATADVKTATDDLADAQQHLNDVTQSYTDQLAPLTAQLSTLQEQERAIQEERDKATIAHDLDPARQALETQKNQLELQQAQNELASVDADTAAKAAAYQKTIDSSKSSQAEKDKAALDLAGLQTEAELKKIDLREKINGLQDALGDKTKTELAQNKLAQLQQQDKIAAINKEKAAAEAVAKQAVEADKKKLDAAKEQQQKQQDLVNAAKAALTTAQNHLKAEEDKTKEFQKQLDLIAQQQKLEAGSGGGGGAHGGAGKGGGAGVGTGTKPKPTPPEGRGYGNGFTRQKADEDETRPPSTAAMSAYEKAVHQIMDQVKYDIAAVEAFLQPVFAALGGLFREAALVVGGVFATAIREAGRVFADLAPDFVMVRDAVVQVINGITTVLPGVGSVLDGIISVVGNVIDVVGRFLAPAFKGAGDAIQAVAPHVEDFLTSMGNLFSTVGSVIGRLAPVATFLGGVLGEAFRVVGSVAGWVLDKLSVFANWLTGQLQSALAGTNPVVNAFGAVLTALGTVVQNVVTWVVAHWPDIQNAISTAWNNVIHPVLQALGDFITTTVLPTIQNIVNWVVTNWPNIQNAISVAWGQIQPIFAAIVAFIADPLLVTVQNIVSWIVNNWGTITAPIANAWNNVIKPAFDLFIAGLGNLLTGAQTIVGWVVDHWSDITTPIHSVWVNGVEQPLQLFTTALGDIWNAGKNVVSWFGSSWNDISTAVTNVWNTISGILQTMGNTINNIMTAIGNLKNAASNIPGIGGLISREDGGVVPGAYGEPRLIIAHGGEVFHGMKGQYGPTLQDMVRSVATLPANGGSGLALPAPAASRQVTMHNEFHIYGGGETLAQQIADEVERRYQAAFHEGNV